MYPEVAKPSHRVRARGIMRGREAEGFPQGARPMVCNYGSRLPFFFVCFFSKARHSLRGCQAPVAT
jgi:hypothetical protein